MELAYTEGGAEECADKGGIAGDGFILIEGGLVSVSVRAGSWRVEVAADCYLCLLVSKVCTYDLRMFGRLETSFSRRPRTSGGDEFAAFLDIQRLVVKSFQCHLHGSCKPWGELSTSRRPKDDRSTSVFNAQMHPSFQYHPTSTRTRDTRPPICDPIVVCFQLGYF